MVSLASELDTVEEVAHIRVQLDRLREELKSRGQELSDPAEAEMAARYARFDERERRLWAILEHPHNATHPRTLEP